MATFDTITDLLIPRDAAEQFLPKEPTVRLPTSMENIEKNTREAIPILGALTVLSLALSFLIGPIAFFLVPAFFLVRMVL